MSASALRDRAAVVVREEALELAGVGVGLAELIVRRHAADQEREVLRAQWYRELDRLGLLCEVLVQHVGEMVRDGLGQLRPQEEMYPRRRVRHRLELLDPALQIKGLREDFVQPLDLLNFYQSTSGHRQLQAQPTCGFEDEQL